MKIITLFLTALILSSCGKPSFYKPENLQQELFKKESEVAYETKVIEIDEIKVKDDFNLEAINGDISIELKNGIPLYNFITLALKNKSISAVVNISQKDAITVNVPYYKGKVSGLLASLSEAYGIFFKYKNGTLVVTIKDRFYINVNRYTEIGKTMENNLKTLGAEQVTYDPVSSRISFVSDYKAYVKIISFVKEINNNLSILTFHMIVGEVELTDKFQAGIDWESLSAAYLSPKSILNQSMAQQTTSTRSHSKL